MTKEERNLCKQIAKKHRKDIEYGDFYIEPKTQEGVLLWDYEDSRYLVGDQCSDTVPLWTIKDCFEFLRGRDVDLTLNYFTHVGWWQVQLWNESSTQAFYSDFNKENKNKTPLEACLKAVLAVLEEKK